jgi:hypothetical protein
MTSYDKNDKNISLSAELVKKDKVVRAFLRTAGGIGCHRVSLFLISISALLSSTRPILVGPLMAMRTLLCCTLL